MTEQLIIRLGSSSLDPIQWLVWSAQEQDIIASGELPDASHLHSLKDRAGGRPVTALAPTSEIRMQWVSLPAKAGRKALAAIPFMLEDELSTDIDNQLFALGPRQGLRQAVAIVDKRRLQEWLDWLAEGGLVCNKVLPDVLALPLHENGWSLLKLGNQIMLRQDEWRGMQGEQSWMLAAIEHVAKQQVSPLTLANYSDIQLPALPSLEEQPEQLEMPMKVLAQGALGATFNLLQGEFKPKKQRTQQGSKWRLVAVLAGIALTTSLVDKAVQANHLANERNNLQLQILQEFQRAFPEVKRVVNVKSQMTQKLNELQQGSGGVSMLVMLSQLSDAFEKSQIKPQTLKFDVKRAELRMQAAGKNFEALEQFRRLAESQGFTVQQGAINNTDNQVIGTLSIRS
ncbi:type II secretion system protein GspL [Aliiglaciecola sp. CAU 1673]|uniref:type II secretion system protein GspL n=1 Tax=Aliiglaciecola sp. CAU 1673 TaxID=3032595 RepID=UPI0023DC509D|nr:type II secretion system protein GspL [Aliiglaciecola sp. CAU 1673]MDF2179222.1 type II secretion system protein GspL [Aliiglaciecola sp. CAU 1673]